MKILLVLFKNIMTKKALPKMKMMTIICFGTCLGFNVLLVPPMFLDVGYMLLPFKAMLLAIVLSLGAMLGGPIFKLVTPQAHYINKSKIHLIGSEFSYGLVFGIAPYAVIIYCFY